MVFREHFPYTTVLEDVACCIVITRLILIVQPVRLESRRGPVWERELHQVSNFFICSHLVVCNAHTQEKEIHTCVVNCRGVEGAPFFLSSVLPANRKLCRNVWKRINGKRRGKFSQSMVRVVQFPFCEVMSYALMSCLHFARFASFNIIRIEV